MCLTSVVEVEEMAEAQTPPGADAGATPEDPTAGAEVSAGITDLETTQVVAASIGGGGDACVVGRSHLSPRATPASSRGPTDRPSHITRPAGDHLVGGHFDGGVGGGGGGSGGGGWGHRVLAV